MKRFIPAIVLTMSLFGAGVALAGEQTVTLVVENMTCASCPYIVKQSLTAIPGVTNVAVSFEEKSATVSFDDAKTTADALIDATTKAGYPAKLEAAPPAAVTQ
jgi:mercuric ion binding protein